VSSAIAAERVISPEVVSGRRLVRLTSLTSKGDALWSANLAGSLERTRARRACLKSELSTPI
jgi:hypothetical protein